MIEKLKAFLSDMTWKTAERWVILVYLALQLMLMFLSPASSIAMGIFLISVLLAANSF